MGFRNIADGNSSAAFGTNSIASGDYSLALGSSDQPDTGARVAAGATNGVAIGRNAAVAAAGVDAIRSEEHTSELQSLMRTSYAVFCLKKKTHNKRQNSEQKN